MANAEIGPDPRTRRHQEVRLAILGDRLPGYPKHSAIAPALESAATALDCRIKVMWITSDQLTNDAESILWQFDGAVAAPQSHEYCKNIEGLLSSLKFVREHDQCFLATCGGAQLALQEQLAGDCNSVPSGSVLKVASCGRPGDDYRVAGLKQIRLSPGTLSARSYNRSTVTEPFACNFVLGSAAEELLERHGLLVTGTSPGIGPVLFERPEQRFHVAVLYLPQLSEQQPHPLFVSFLRTICASRRRRKADPKPSRAEASPRKTW